MFNRGEKMKKLLILGAGQYGSVAYDIAKNTGEFSQIEFLDDNNPAAIGKFSDYMNFSGDFSHAVVAIGNSDIKLDYLEKLKNAGFCVSPLISPMAFVSESARLYDGVIIEPLAAVSANAVIESGSFVSSGAVVNHNAVVGKGCHIDCNCTVAARAVVKEKTKLPCGSVAE